MAKDKSIKAVYESPDNPGREGGRKKGNALMSIVAVTVLLGVAFVVSSPIVFSRAQRSRAVQAMNNGKDIYVGLRDYAIARGGQIPKEASSSNEIFEELFRTKVICDSKPFFVEEAEHVKNATAGDYDDRLTEGENMYAYWVRCNGSGISITKDSCNSPILSIPNLSTSKNADFNSAVYCQKSFDDQAVIVQADGAALAIRLDDQGRLIDIEGLPYKLTDSEKSISGVDFKVCLPLGVKKYEPNR